MKLLDYEFVEMMAVPRHWPKDGKVYAGQGRPNFTPKGEFSTYGQLLKRGGVTFWIWEEGFWWRISERQGRCDMCNGRGKVPIWKHSPIKPNRNKS